MPRQENDAIVTKIVTKCIHIAKDRVGIVRKKDYVSALRLETLDVRN